MRTRILKYLYILKMNEFLYRKLLYRRKFCTRIIILIIVFLFFLITLVLLFGNLKVPLVSQLTELNTCPACFGISACPELYSNKILFEERPRWQSLFNAKNIFYGFTKSKRRVVVKKLAHDWELHDFDSKLCQTWNLRANCKPSDLINASNVADKVVESVSINLSSLEAKPRKGLILCPYPHGIFKLIDSIVHRDKRRKNVSKLDLLHIWTVLNVNPEPIILQLLKKSEGWLVPTYVGVCGRLEIVAHEGEPLYFLTDQPYKTKLIYAKQIITAALDFTSKHDRYRFYLMDWSIDNIVANKNNNISFVDLEDVIILDKHVSPSTDLPDWYKRYYREDFGPGFSFSVQNICKHHLSDHNLWAACYVLAGDDRPFLYPIPTNINSSRPQLDLLLNKCVYSNNINRFRLINQLQLIIEGIITDETIT